DLRHPPPFPTRRSSDLAAATGATRSTAPPPGRARPGARRGTRCDRSDSRERLPGAMGWEAPLRIPCIFWRLAVGIKRILSRSPRSEEHTSELQSPYDLV